MKLRFDGSQWNQVWNTSPVSKDSIVCPQILNSPIVAVLISSPTTNKFGEYRLGAYIQREVFTGLTVGGQPDARLDGARKLYVNRLQVFTYSTACNYSLVASCFTYGGAVQLFVWEYTGVIN